MKQYAVVVMCDLSLKIVSYERENEVIDYNDFCDLKTQCSTKIDLWEIVPMAFPDGFLMLVAEDGKLRGLPENRVASVFYGNIFDFISGDVVVVHRCEWDSSEIRWLTSQEVERLQKHFSNMKVCNLDLPMD